jgi:hypothetical protein
MKYAIIRYPAGTAPGKPQPRMSLSAYCGITPERREDYIRSTATIDEKETLEEAKVRLREICGNEYCIETKLASDEMSVTATRNDGFKFTFDIIEKR